MTSPLQAFRQLVHDGVNEWLAYDSYGKRYEGHIEYSADLPGVHDAHDTKPTYTLKLHCYVMGPQRHYEWTGDDEAAVFASATADVQSWITENREQMKDDA